MIAPRQRTPALAVALGSAGLGLAGVGLWARRDVSRTLAQEGVTGPADAQPANGPVSDAKGARAMAEFIRRNTVEATGGRTYAQTEAYVDATGKPTSEPAHAAKDDRTGRPIESPDHELWIQSITLQTALMQAYLAFRLSELTVALGGAFFAVGVGLAAAGRRPLRG